MIIRMIAVEIPGQPHAQGRPRARAIAGHAQIYERAEDRDWKLEAREHLIEVDCEPLDGPVMLRILAVFACPKSAHRKLTQVPRHFHAKRPDADNVTKALKDAASGILWYDDAQVADERTIKVVGAQEEPPRLLIYAKEIGDAYMAHEGFHLLESAHQLELIG